MHHHDTLGNRENDIHVMLTEQNRQAPHLCQPLDELHRCRCLLRRHPSSRLIQDQELWFIPQSDGDLKYFLVTMG